jgi:hypothetical protein
VAKKYKKKTPVAFKYEHFSRFIPGPRVKTSHDGLKWVVYTVPLDSCEYEEEVKFRFGMLAERHLEFQKQLEKGVRLRKPWGSKSGSRKKIDKRDEKIKEIYEMEKQKKTARIMIPDKVNGELRRRKYLSPGANLSDRRIREIKSK